MKEKEEYDLIFSLVTANVLTQISLLEPEPEAFAGHQSDSVRQEEEEELMVGEPASDPLHPVLRRFRLLQFPEYYDLARKIREVVKAIWDK
jgi:hypothetical protein